MAKKERRFIVINLKRLEELDATTGDNREHWAFNRLGVVLKDFKEDYEYKTGKKLDQEYIVCNQNEPYADKVWQIILDHEDMKGE
jgi:hypothetical protein